MNVRVEVVCIGVDGTEQRRDVMTIQRAELVMETLGMNLTEGKALLAGVQDIVVAHQVNEYLENHRACLGCGKRYANKDSGSTPVKTLFGRVDVVESALASVCVPSGRPEDLSASKRVARWANHSGDAVPGDKVGLLAPLRARSGSAEGSTAGWRFD